jgi:hypothetical protein
MLKHTLFFFIYTFIVAINAAYAQQGNVIQTGQLLFGNDTIPVLELKAVPIITRKFIDDVDEYQFNQLMRNIMVVYPYAMKSQEMIRLVQEATADIREKKEKKEYKQDLENKLEGEFRKDLENLTTTQGKILVEWIERSSGKTLHQIIKENKSGFSAFTWSFTAARFGYELKTPYDAKQYPDLELILHSFDD